MPSRRIDEPSTDTDQPMIQHRRVIGTILWATVFFFVGCGEVAKKTAESRKVPPPVKVFLPPTPNLNRPEPARQHSDGVYTVYGLLKNKDALAGKEVSVRGLLAELRVCSESDEGLCALPTHAVLTDEVGDIRSTIPVVGVRLKSMPGVQLGLPLEVTGKLDSLSRDGRIVSLEGLLILPLPEEKERQRAKSKPRRRAPRVNVTAPQ